MMQKSIIVATVISLYSVENFPKNSLRAPLLLKSLEYLHSNTSSEQALTYSFLAYLSFIDSILGLDDALNVSNVFHCTSLNL